PQPGTRPVRAGWRPPISRRHSSTASWRRCPRRITHHPMVSALPGARLLAPGRASALIAAILAAVLAATVAVIVYQHNPGWMYDVKVYRRGGAPARHGLDVYRRFPPPAFTYPPFAAVLFIPLSVLPVNWTGLLWTTASIVCLQASTWLCLGRPAIDRDRRGVLLCAGAGAPGARRGPRGRALLPGGGEPVL